MDKFKGNRKLAMLFILLSIGWMAMLFTESSQPPAPIMGEVPGLDKLAHFVAFAVLALLMCAASFNLHGRLTIPLLSVPLLVTALAGLIEEGYQMSVPGRQGSLSDFVADLTGTVFAVWFANRIALILRCRNPIKMD